VLLTWSAAVWSGWQLRDMYVEWKRKRDAR